MAGINISGSNTWEDDITIYTIESFVKGNDISLPDIDNDSNIPLRQLTNRTFRIKSMLDKYGIYIKDEEFKYAGQNLIQSTAIRGDIVNGNLVSFYNNEFWKLDLSQSDEREIFIGIADKTNNRIITNGLIEIINISLRGYNEGDLLYADNENSGEITNIESNTPIGRYLFNDIIYVSLVVSEYQNIRQSKLDNPVCNILCKNKIINKGSGSLTWKRDSKATYIDLYGNVKTAKNDEPRQEKDGWLFEGESTNLLPYSVIDNNWQTVISTITKNISIAPDKSNDTTLISFINDPMSRVFYGILSLPSDTYTISCWLWGDIDGEIVRFGIHRIAWIYSSDITLTTTPTRYSFTITPTDISDYVGIFNGSDGLARDINIWGFQLEKMPFATSYIPTDGIPATRAGDIVSIPFEGNHPNVTQRNSDFSYFLTVNSLGVNTIIQTFFSFDKIIDLSFKFSLFRIGENSNKFSYYRSLGFDQISVNDITQNNNIAITISNDYVTTYSNGNLKTTGDKIPIVNNKNPSNILLGYRDEYYAPLYGHILDFRIYDFVLNPSEVKFLSGE